MFVHGLEGHPEGAKVLGLRAQGFDVVAPNMHMSLYKLARRNSVVRQLLRLTEVRVVGLLTPLALALTLAAHAFVGALALLTAALLWFAARRKPLIARALARSFDACVAIQAAALREVAPDVVVGSSWGGAVVAELILRGSWTGPTILLAPAIQVVLERTGRGGVARHNEQLRACSMQMRVSGAPLVIFHDPSDATIPYADSVRLAEASPIQLETVDAGGHALLGLLESGQLAAAIRAVGSRS